MPELTSTPDPESAEAGAARAAFEAWYSRGQFMPHLFSRFAKGAYPDRATRHAWEVWQAALQWRDSLITDTEG